MRIGLDVGSTTLKCVVLDDNENIVFHSYERHYSSINEKTISLLKQIKQQFPEQESFYMAISGSAGMGLSQSTYVPFVQEVYATKVAADKLTNEADVIIELGGEDAKILFLTDGFEVRMNGSCAGGTGAFIDQMATLLNISPTEMNELSKKHDKIYTIASRCGVFAKSDIQPLLNQGARKQDICASIFYAVVNQTVAGLAQGRTIDGNVVYLGGPLTFLSELRTSFDKTLSVNGQCPENSLYFVSLGAAYCASNKVLLDNVIFLAQNQKHENKYVGGTPLFSSEAEYDEFLKRHSKNSVLTVDDEQYDGNVYLGIDAGSTTVKLTAINEDEDIIFSKYMSNSGNPVPIVKEFLMEYYKKFKNAKIKGASVTGYGEEIIKHAFKIDFGIVETIAHFTAAKKFKPNVDFIIDIGGQDIKCFKIRNQAIDNIFLNEACSSGCGSFLQTFAGALDMTIADFAKQGLFAKNPVDLGSRCTVFMNSSVKQAQKDGATLDNISAGLSISVVKNALYKVIRATDASQIGENIVVQGGTFLNDAVLRAFEQELKKEVVRPNIAGLMGAYGAALYAKFASSKQNGNENYDKEDYKSTIISQSELRSFSHSVNMATCRLCSNNCRLTVNTFGKERKFIGGNRCEKPVQKSVGLGDDFNIYSYKLKLLDEYALKKQEGKRGKIGIPLVLNMFELLPFWHTFFTKLNFEVVVSQKSNRNTYLKGQHTIPSDTVCFPAKLVHGHIEQLIEDGINTIFYPCMTYNLNEEQGDNHYNCPVVAYYPEVIKVSNIKDAKDYKHNITLIYDYLGLHRKKDFVIKMHEVLSKYFNGISPKEVKEAAHLAYDEYYAFLEKIRKKGKEIINAASSQNVPVIVVAGRPYHIDPEINHGIDKLICESGAAVVSEDGIDAKLTQKVSVLNQWTYHSRLYAAAQYVSKNDNLNLVQLVSFGCGVDAITTDEVRSILEANGKIYTQIKIDEITNLGAIKIRLRSLFGALNQGI